MRILHIIDDNNALCVFFTVYSARYAVMQCNFFIRMGQLPFNHSPRGQADYYSMYHGFEIRALILIIIIISHT